MIKLIFQHEDNQCKEISIMLKGEPMPTSFVHIKNIYQLPIINSMLNIAYQSDYIFYKKLCNIQHQSCICISQQTTLDVLLE